MSTARLIVKRSQIIDDGQPEHRLQETSNQVANDQQTLHLLPCKIHPLKPKANSETLKAPVDRYFRPYTKGAESTKNPMVDAITDKNDSANSNLWQASLRGKPLKGVKIDLPEGYVGVLCNSSNSKADGNDSVTSMNFIADDKEGDFIQQFMYWNWDRVPNREDPLLAALNWIHLSEAIMTNNDN